MNLFRIYVIFNKFRNLSEGKFYLHYNRVSLSKCWFEKYPLGCIFKATVTMERNLKFSLLSVYERNIFRAQMFQIIDEFSCDWRICIFYVIDATRHIGLCKKAGSCYCGVFNVLIILKCVSIEDLSFKMHTGLVTTMYFWVSSVFIGGTSLFTLHFLQSDWI